MIGSGSFNNKGQVCSVTSGITVNDSTNHNKVKCLIGKQTDSTKCKAEKAAPLLVVAEGWVGGGCHYPNGYLYKGHTQYMQKIGV